MRTFATRLVLLGLSLAAGCPAFAQASGPRYSASSVQPARSRWGATRWTGNSGWSVRTRFRGRLPQYGEPFDMSAVQAILHHVPEAPCAGWADGTDLDAPGIQAAGAVPDASRRTRVVLQSAVLAGGCIALVRESTGRIRDGGTSALTLYFTPRQGMGWGMDLGPFDVRSPRYPLLVGPETAYTYTPREAGGWTLTAVRPDGQVVYQSDAFVPPPGVESGRRAPAVEAPAGGLYTLAGAGRSLALVRLASDGQEVWRTPIPDLSDVSVIHALGDGSVFLSGTRSDARGACRSTGYSGFAVLMVGSDGTRGQAQPVADRIVLAEHDAHGMYTAGLEAYPCPERLTGSVRGDAPARTSTVVVRHVRPDGTTDHVSRAPVTNEFGIDLHGLRQVGGDLVLTALFDVVDAGRPQRYAVEFAFGVGTSAVTGSDAEAGQRRRR